LGRIRYIYSTIIVWDAIRNVATPTSLQS
jgi:hypothetical protein